MGVDMMGTGDFLRLPEEALDQHVRLLKLIEAQAAWPPQVHSTIAAMVPKKLGGDRALGAPPQHCSHRGPLEGGPMRPLEWRAT
eukprot:4584732-Pyramimonas_sp.AAC.1